MEQNTSDSQHQEVSESPENKINAKLEEASSTQEW